MRILLTGSNGMVGKNILDQHHAYNYEFLTPGRNELDLLSFIDVKQYIERYRPDPIIHAAGLVGGIQDNISRPFSFLHENALMGLNLLSSAYAAGVNKFINLGSSCMYPRDAKNPLSESSIMKGELEPTNEGYALAKIMCNKLCDYVSKENSNFFLQNNYSVQSLWTL